MKIDREKFFAGIKNIIDSGAVKVVGDLPPDAYIVVTRVEDFDPESNDVWQLQANKSYPREGLVCNECKMPVVMSDGVYEKYLKNPVPHQILCGQCLGKDLL